MAPVPLSMMPAKPLTSLLALLSPPMSLSLSKVVSPAKEREGGRKNEISFRRQHGLHPVTTDK